MKPEQRSAPKCLFGQFPLLLFAVLVTLPISVVRQKPLICEQYNRFLCVLKHTKGHRGTLTEVQQVGSVFVALPAGIEIWSFQESN